MLSVFAEGCEGIEGISLFHPSGLTSAARATETMARNPASFADVVAKVKPAVLSVRVKVNAAAEMFCFCVSNSLLLALK